MPDQVDYILESFKSFQQLGHDSPIQMHAGDQPPDTDSSVLTRPEVCYLGESRIVYSRFNDQLAWLSDALSNPPSPEFSFGTGFVSGAEMRDLWHTTFGGVWQAIGANVASHGFPLVIDWPTLADIRRGIDAIEQAFNQIPDESAEAGHGAPPDEVIRETRRIVLRMLWLWPSEYDVYPMDERRVAVEVDGGFGRRMLLVCEAGGSAMCAVTKNRISRRARYEDSSILPDGFILDAIRDLRTSEKELSSASRGADGP